MVATVTSLSSAAVTTRYFERDGYYAKSDPEHRRASRWHGRGAAALGLGRHVAPSRFAAVLAGQVPGTDTVLGRIRDGRREHRPGTDVTLQAPKSVSLAALVAGDARVVRAHDAAVRETLDFVEGNLLAVRQWDRERKRHVRVPSPSMVAATFRHKANRNLEPHLHTHAVIANMTRKPDGSWASLEAGALARSEKLMGAHYRNALAARLLRLGYELRPSMVGQVPGFEIAGCGRELLEENSSRRREIVAWVRARGLADTAANRQRAALATRKAKDEPHHRELEAGWRASAKEMGLDRKPPRPSAGRRRAEREAGTHPTMTEIVTRSAEHLAERASVFREADLCTLALAHSPGLHTHADYRTALDGMKRDGHLVDAVRGGLGPCLVTSRALRAEREIVERMQAARETGRPLADAGRVEAALGRGALTEGQREAVRAILLGRGRIAGVQGYAGTGKTAMLRAVRALAGNRRVVALAPSAAAVRSLRREAGLPARTLQGFLSRHRDVAEGTVGAEGLARLRALHSGSVLVLDEASMAGTVQVRSLMRIADALDVGRLVLVGDTRQLRSIEAGQPFRQLQEAGMPTAVMDDVLRQRTPHLREAVAHVIGGRPREALGRLGDDVHEVGAGELGRTAARLWLDLDPSARAATAILAPTHGIRAEIAATVREGLASEGVLKGREIEIQRLVSRGLTRPQTGDVRNWEEGDAAVFHHDLWGGKAKAGEVFTVDAVDGERAALVHDDGRVLKVKPGGKGLRYQLELHETATIRLRAGDEIRWTRNDNRRDLVNGERAQVLSVGPKAVRFRTSDGRGLKLSRDDPQLRHIDHACSSTVHGAQGTTADRVIAVLDSGHGALADQATFYVEVTRARDEAVVLTDSREQLAETLEERTGLRMTALEAVGERVAERERETVPGTAPEAALPEKAPVLSTARAFEKLRAEARAAGISVLDAPGFGDMAERLERERQRPGLPEAERTALDAWRAEIGSESARRGAATGYPERAIAAAKAVEAAERTPGPEDAVMKAADALVAEGRSMLASPEHAPHLDRIRGLRKRTASGLDALETALAANGAERAWTDWRETEAKAAADGVNPFRSERGEELLRRIEALAGDGRVPAARREAFRTVLDGRRADRERNRQAREITERARRCIDGREAVLRDGRPGIPRLPQQRQEYGAWRREAERLHADANRLLREDPRVGPHLEEAGWSAARARSWLQRLEGRFRRDDAALETAERRPVHDLPERGADARHPVPCAGDLVLGDRVRWLEPGDGGTGIREGRIVDIRHDPDALGDRILVAGDGPRGTDRRFDASELLRGDAHRQVWPDEEARERMRAEATGPFTVACAVDEDARVGGPDDPGEARLVAGDRIRWIERPDSDGPMAEAGVRAVEATVDEVVAGSAPRLDRIRLTVDSSTGDGALPRGARLEVEPGRLRMSGRFHRMPWPREDVRRDRLAELAARTRMIERSMPSVEMPSIEPW